jgi:hypothetical protein
MTIKSKQGPLELRWKVKGGFEIKKQTRDFLSALLKVTQNELNFLVYLNIYFPEIFDRYCLEKNDMYRKFFSMYGKETKYNDMSIN